MYRSHRLICCYLSQLYGFCWDFEELSAAVVVWNVEDWVVMNLWFSVISPIALFSFFFFLMQFHHIEQFTCLSIMRVRLLFLCVSSLKRKWWRWFWRTLFLVLSLSVFLFHEEFCNFGLSLILCQLKRPLHYIFHSFQWNFFLLFFWKIWRWLEH